MKKGVTKPCEICKTPFYQPPSHTRVRTCSIKCGGILRRGKPSKKKGQKGIQTAWNKGTKILVEKNCLTCWESFVSEPSHLRKYCSVKCSAVQRLGENNHKWIKDRGELQKGEDRRHSAYVYWSKCVKNRDGWVCKISNGTCSGRLEAHHILSWIDYPELRYELNNGITLCLAHHPRKRAEEKRLSPYFQSLVSVSKV